MHITRLYMYLAYLVPFMLWFTIKYRVEMWGLSICSTGALLKLKTQPLYGWMGVSLSLSVCSVKTRAHGPFDWKDFSVNSTIFPFLFFTHFYLMLGYNEPHDEKKLTTMENQQEKQPLRCSTQAVTDVGQLIGYICWI